MWGGGRGEGDGGGGKKKSPLTDLCFFVFKQAAFLSLSERTKQQSIETIIQTHQSIHALFSSPEILSPLTIVHTETGYLLRREWDPQRGGGDAIFTRSWDVHRGRLASRYIQLPVHMHPHPRPCTTAPPVCTYPSCDPVSRCNPTLSIVISVNALTPGVYHSRNPPTTVYASPSYISVSLMCTSPV